MELALGLDVGTSAAKAVLVDSLGHVRGTAVATYPIAEPKPGWAEQDLATWWEAVRQVVRCLRLQQDGPALLHGVSAIGLSGQMHGTVVLGRDGQPLRPAIIWADGRSAVEAEALNAEFGARGLSKHVGGRVASGFLAATLAWLRSHEPQTWELIATCMLPKDALRLRLTGGAPLTEASDASGTLLLDIQRRDWSQPALACLGLHAGILPPVREAADVVGALSQEAGAALGLRPGIPVIAGGSDQGMAAVGAGVLEPGDLLISVSTGGQLVAPLAEPVMDEQLRAFTLCHVIRGRSYCMSTALSAGLALRWLRQNVLGDPSDEVFDRLLADAAVLRPGADGLIFLPYLLGERAPSLGPHARAVFCGLGLRHARPHLVRAVLEGVALSLREALEVLLALGVQPRRIVVAGGGMRVALWRQVLADVLGRDVLPLAVADQSALGAALLAGVATALFPDLTTACRLAVAYDAALRHNTEAAGRYDQVYSLFRGLYPAVQPTLVTLCEQAQTALNETTAMG